MSAVATASLPVASAAARADATRPRADARTALAGAFFRSGLLCLAVAALFGLGLRTRLWRGGLAIDFTHLLHAHSHLALLGWVGNAFFALAFHAFLDDADAGRARRVWFGQLLALAGMTIAFLVAGYGPAAIAFCTLHLAGSLWLAARLWRSTRAAPAARDFLRVAVVWLALSCLGPLLLGPIAALGLRDTALYRLALHLYLHGLAHGWMPFFLLAVLVQRFASRASPETARRLREALRWLAAGSALGLASPAFSDAGARVFQTIAALGAIAGLAGTWGLVRALRRARSSASPALAVGGWLRVALLAFVLKGVSQLAVAAPRLAWLAGERQAQIAFLHLMFLGVVAPVLFDAASTSGWFLRPRLGALAGWGFLASAATGEALLGLLLLGRAPADPAAWLWGSALALTLAALGLACAACGRSGAPSARPAFSP